MFKSLILLLSFTAFSVVSFAAQVTTVKGNKIVLTLDAGDDFQADQKIKVLNSSNKTIGLAVITLVKGGKAVATIEKGKAREGLKAELTKASLAKKAPPKPTTEPAEEVSDSVETTTTKAKTTKYVKAKRYVGGIGGIVMDSADVKFTPDGGGAAQSVSLSGMGFSAKGLYELPLSRSYSVRLLSGIEQFVAEGPSRSSCKGKCEIKINYLAFDGWARFLFATTGYKPWAGVGISILYPITKTSSTLDEGSIKPTSFLSFGGGIDYQLSRRSQIPIQIEYGFAPSSSNVTASALAIRAGYSFVY